MNSRIKIVDDTSTNVIADNIKVHYIKCNDPEPYCEPIRKQKTYLDLGKKDRFQRGK